LLCDNPGDLHQLFLGDHPILGQRAADPGEGSLLPTLDQIAATAVGHQQPGGVGTDINAGASQ
jgi:hypothetical protein